MDFPKSVPGVGLVGDRFVDEDPAIGRQGSLIPSAWGNAVTLELLNVIQAAGLEPSEAHTDQLLEAIRALVPERSAFARITGTQVLPASAFGIYALADGGAAATVTLPTTADLVDDTELLLFANHANTAVVQVKAGAGQTVQGPAALMGESTTAFMLPAGGDWVRLRSEKAQGRWVVVAHWSAKRVTALENSHGLLTITGNAALTGTDNKLVMAGIVPALKLEKGDVILITGAGEINAKPRTVESISGTGELILNYEHCGARGNGPLKLQDYSGQVTITRLAKWFNAPFGLGQDWVVVDAFRSTGVSTNNSSGRSIFVFGSVNGGDAGLQLSANNVFIDASLVTAVSSNQFVRGVVPNGADYVFTSTKSLSLVRELR